MKPVKNGIPQESPTSSILTSFYLVGLLNIFKTSANLIMISDIYTYNYFIHISILINVDDGKLTISSLSLDTNNFMLAKAYQSQLDSPLIKIRENLYIILK